MNRTNETIQKEIKELESKVLELKNELAEKTNYVLMYMEKSGKHTFVLQSKSQKQNLISSGWKVYSKNQLNSFLDNYEF